MNRIKGILIACTLLMAASGFSQTSTSKPSTPADPGTFPEVSFKKSKIAESQQTRGEDVLWKRDVYRIVNLLDGNNGALYFPVEPTNDRQNLFCTLFNMVADGRLTAYEYLDGREIFSDAYALKFKDLLTRNEIPFKEKADPKKANAFIYDIDAVDIPSSEVTLFYVKEVYYLDQRNSTMRIKTVAICPVLVRTDEVGETRKKPMFWVPFEVLKGALSQIPVSADTINSVSRMNAYDFFNQHRYKGDIYKVSNLRNQSLYDYCRTPEEIAKEQLRIENELKNMSDKLWEPSQRELREAEAQKDAEAKIAAKKAKEAALKAPKRSVSTSPKKP
ncbi:MAG TPA: gliding motility protein GldN [Bacteroidales bacterium]|nr:gliding motility protein GldN [Bacteroidales bacterium]